MEPRGIVVTRCTQQMKNAPVVHKPLALFARDLHEQRHVLQLVRGAACRRVKAEQTVSEDNVDILCADDLERHEHLVHSLGPLEGRCTHCRSLPTRSSASPERRARRDRKDRYSDQPQPGCRGEAQPGMTGAPREGCESPTGGRAPFLVGGKRRPWVPAWQRQRDETADASRAVFLPMNAIHMSG